MKEQIQDALAQLRTTIQDARSMPMSASAVVNRADVLAQIDELEAAVHDTLSQASEVVGDRDAVVAEGQSEADEILRNAREEADMLVSDTDVYKVAQQRADEVTAQAVTDAEQLRRETDEYVESTLANFEVTLDKTLQSVRRGLARLTEGHTQGLADDSDVADMSLPDHLHRGRPASVEDDPETVVGS